MKIAIVHDDLVQWGGAERVLEGICEVFPDAPIYTSVFDRQNKELNKRFGHKKVITSFLQKIPFWKKLYKPLLPLYPIAFEQFNFDDFDVVLSHTTRFAKCIITKPETKHICYCHTPPRFLWNFNEEKPSKFLEIFLTKMRAFDQISAHRVDTFLAGSKNAQIRIKKVYQQNSQVLYPFIDTKNFNGYESFDGGYLVVIARLNKYKKVELAVNACLELDRPLIVIGKGSEENYLRSLGSSKPGLIRFMNQVDDDLKNLILSGAQALIISAKEDFGLTALEAQALGKPVIAFGAGGACETVIEGKTGLFFNEQTTQSLKDKIQELDHTKINPRDCQENAERFNLDVFKKNLRHLILD